MVLRDECFLKVTLDPDRHQDRFIGKPVSDLELPGDCKIPVLRRDGQLLAPKPDTKLRQGDQLSIIGEPDAIQELKEEVRETEERDEE